MLRLPGVTRVYVESHGRRSFSSLDSPLEGLARELGMSLSLEHNGPFSPFPDEEDHRSFSLIQTTRALHDKIIAPLILMGLTHRKKSRNSYSKGKERFKLVKSTTRSTSASGGTRVDGRNWRKETLHSKHVIGKDGGGVIHVTRKDKSFSLDLHLLVLPWIVFLQSSGGSSSWIIFLQSSRGSSLISSSGSPKIKVFNGI
ncbi:hypothetical protein M5K25_008992 [Dendrobium thyrsiflorum]|uniref:Uncharacterized protein n=1 Tax=Dendrobium thyrsiflorum TaxID=117978 RepID=A0ABD0VBC1_DENTH